MISPTDTAASASGHASRRCGARPSLYLLLTAVLAALLLAALAFANYRLAPLSYSAAAQAEVARTLASGSNHAVFDLNLDMRELRRQHIARLERTPDVIVLGASHWQEAHADLLPGGASTTPTSIATITRICWPWPRC